MNLSTAVFLINKNVRAIAGIYSAEGPIGSPAPQRTVFKTLDPSVKVGDYVLVPTNTRHCMTVNRVVAVDVDVDFDSSVQMNWVINKVDRAAYEETLAMEAQAVAVIRSAELRQKREKLREAVLVDQVAQDAIKLLPIYKNGDTNTA